ncbi:cytidine deaminase-like protein [Fimicolochytrium jonesii]|uniref:cytidine deaminase-like protein n=1 Tax=Fimicolochytrium jonesii TaxID=1396493 RepID=UPI0022FEDE47|nr:cytidine deaminase-like protein [Fimicolochytrium jonesii]KAI8819621.1 cytidine deaminase-like protein [Fimicolochytrium jonesii]
MEGVYGDERTRALSTVDIFIVDVEPKHLSKLMKATGKEFPLSGLDHLKRVRKTQSENGKQTCSFFLSPRSLTTQPELESFLAKLEIPHSPIATAQVSRYAAITREQFEEWKQLWPMSYHDHAIKLDAPPTDEEIALAQRWMREVVQLARSVAIEDEGRGLRANAAVMVDPATNTRLVVADDCRASHPLGHATMRCIAAVAERENRRRGNADFNEDAVVGQKRKAHADDEATTTPWSSSLSDQLGGAAATAGKSGYLCTDLDLYVLREPCSMCAMALVHSRIGRVFYAVREPHGALGSAYKVHIHPSLNHHYKVFRDLCGGEARDALGEHDDR